MGRDKFIRISSCSMCPYVRTNKLDYQCIKFGFIVKDKHSIDRRCKLTNIESQKEAMYYALSKKARSAAEVNGIFSDQELKEFVKELKITLRLDFGIKAKTYRNWTQTQVIEKYLKCAGMNLIGGIFSIKNRSDK